MFSIYAIFIAVACAFVAIGLHSLPPGLRPSRVLGPWLAIIALASVGVSIAGADAEFLALVQQNRRAVVGAHILGVALGLGGATIADVFFFKFIRDLRLTPMEMNVLRTLSAVVWIGLALLAVSGAGLFLMDVERYTHSSKFLVKMFVVGIIFLNGLFLNVVLTPHLARMEFGKAHTHRAGELRYDRTLAFISGALSVSSWYFAFTMGMIQKIPLTFLQLFAIYAAVVALAIASSLLLKSMIARL